MKEKSITKVQKQYVTELKWIWPVIVSGDSPKIISSAVASDKITSEPEWLFFLPYRCIESVVCPLTDIVFPHNAFNVQRMSFYQCLPCCPSSCSFSSYSLIFIFLMKVLFRFAPLPPLTINLLKPCALTNAISNRTDWCFHKHGQWRWQPK